MSGTTEIEKQNHQWHSLIAAHEAIFAISMEGTLIQMDEEGTVLKQVNTPLDLPWVLSTKEGVTAVGRWDARWIQWHVSKDRIETFGPLVTGRVTAVSQYADKLYAAAANRDIAIPTPNKKDQVTLSPGMIFQIGNKGEVNQIPTEIIGQIEHLAVAQNVLVFVDSHSPTTIQILDRSSGALSTIASTAAVRCLTVLNDTLLIATDESLVRVALENLSTTTKALPQDFYRVQKIQIIGDDTYLLTSNGVYRSFDFEPITKQDGSPVDMVAHRGGVLTLWQDGTLELYHPDAPLEQFQIKK
ncbi:MAG: hypothetical protein AAF466_08020 [Bacteroidota bacterium]